MDVGVSYPDKLWESPFFAYFSEASTKVTHLSLKQNCLINKYFVFSQTINLFCKHFHILARIFPDMTVYAVSKQKVHEICYQRFKAW